MSTVKVNAAQIGQSITATNNFTWYQPASPDGTVRLGNGNSGSVTDLITVGTTGNLTFANSVSLSAASTKTLTLNGGAGSNGLVLTSGNLVGVGTASPDTHAQLTVNGITQSSSASYAAFQLYNSALGTNPYFRIAYDSANNLVFNNVNTAYNSSTELMRLDSAGNLGLGVTPNGWYSGYTALEFKNYGAITSRAASNSMEILTNAYRNASANYVYKQSGTAQNLEMANGAYNFYTAPSGTANTTFTFTQAMTLDASGNLHVPGGGGITQNEAFGTGALKNNTTGAYNIAAGYLAAGGASAITGSYNVIVGANSALSLTSGVQNVFVGYGCGINLATGSNNIYIGDENIASGAAVSNEIVIGQAITGKGSNTAYLKGSSGVYNSANTSTWATTSDQRIKKNITPIAEGLSIINALNPVNFDYKESGKNEDGFIAQEYQTVLPQQIVSHAPNDAEKEWVDEEVLGIQQNLIPFLVAAIKELSAELNELKQRIK